MSQEELLFSDRNDFNGFSWENFKQAFKPAPRSPQGSERSSLDINPDMKFDSFGQRLKEFFSPSKQPPLPPGIQPVQTKELWTKLTWKDHLRQQGLGSIAAISLMVLIGTTLTLQVRKAEEKQKKNDAVYIPIGAYDPSAIKLPAGNKKAGGGGGANDHTDALVNKGKPPKFAWTQFTPPQPKIQNPNAKLQMDPSLLGPPDLKVVSNLPDIGDPTASGKGDSLGHGNGTGIGNGNGGGLGNGSGGGTGGGVFRAGVNGVGSPTCLYCPQPEYSDEARKAKYQGTVLLDATVTTDGRIINPLIIKGPGLGLEEKALAQIKNWKMRPALSPDGKPINVRVQIEVTFHLY